MRFYTITEFRKLCGVTNQTLRNWDRSGYLKPHHTARNGFRYYSEAQLQQLNGEAYASRKVVGYCLAETKAQLQKQVNSVTAYLAAQGRQFELLSDTTSGTKTGLANLIQLVEEDEVETIVLLSKGVLTSIGWEILQNVAEFHRTKLEVIVQSIYVK